jgi:parallel beta-helix repeat protein
VKPPRGGESEEKRIVYRAAPGEKVVIKGSERIRSWERTESGLWNTVIQNDFFNGYNPYAKSIEWDSDRNSWLYYGQWHHRGDVYLDEEALIEVQTPEEAKQRANTWWCGVDEKETTILANFGDANPNTACTEVNVRGGVFFPDEPYLKYITIDGFTIMHSAERWSGPGPETQYGAVGTRWGYKWIIENCTIRNARANGISIGNHKGASSDNIDTFGHHIIRGNRISRCGQSGICGQRGCVRALVENNLIEEINYRREFGGAETAGIKFHYGIDAVIRNNCIRGVYDDGGNNSFGIWLDYGAQNTRVSGNVIYDTDHFCIFLEANHGPILVDNNILIDNDVRAQSESHMFVHNLFVNCFPVWTSEPRSTPWFVPHSTERAGREPPTPRDDRIFNNIFIYDGLHTLPQDAPGFGVGGNLFLDGARKSRLDSNGITGTTPSHFSLCLEDRKAAIDFMLGNEAFDGAHPLVTSDLLGVAPRTGMRFEEADGSPVDVAADYHGNPIDPKRVMPGPFQGVAEGLNSFTLWPRPKGKPQLARVAVIPCGGARPVRTAGRTAAEDLMGGDGSWPYRWQWRGCRRECRR